MVTEAVVVNHPRSKKKRKSVVNTGGSRGETRNGRIVVAVAVAAAAAAAAAQMNFGFSTDTSCYHIYYSCAFKSMILRLVVGSVVCERDERKTRKFLIERNFNNLFFCYLYCLLTILLFIFNN